MTDYLELACFVEKPHTEQIEALLFEAGALSITVEGVNQALCIDEHDCLSSWSVVKLSALFEQNAMEPQAIEVVEAELQAISVGEPLKWRDVPNANWDIEWRKHIQPTTVGDCLWVGPTWMRPDKAYSYAMHIDPSLAFGTGSHETTFLCLEALCRLSLVGKGVIDFGCGSGILGIAACMMGAKYCIGIDKDLDSVLIAKQNAELNGVQKQFKSWSLEEFAARSEQQFGASQIVMANILSNPLIALSQTLIDLLSEQGTLMLSGILNEQAESVVAAYSDHVQFTSAQHGDWLMLFGEKRTANTKIG